MQSTIRGTNAVHCHQQQIVCRPRNRAIAAELYRAFVLATGSLLVMSLELGTASAQSSSSDSAGGAAPAKGIELRGRVLNAEGKPIPIATVGVTELRRGTLTDDEGRYAIPSLPPGVYHVSFSRVGYAPIVHHFALSATTAALDVTLKESLVELPEVQVTASASATTPLTSPQPTSVLAGEALRQAQTPTLGGTLEQVPGLRSWSTGSGVGQADHPRDAIGSRGDRIERAAARQPAVGRRAWATGRDR